VWARRGAAATSVESDESQSLTAAELASIDSAAEKMPQRVTEAREWAGILGETGVPAAKTVKPLATMFRGLTRFCDDMEEMSIFKK
jgi:hypothetical protein